MVIRHNVVFDVCSSDEILKYFFGCRWNMLNEKLLVTNIFIFLWILIIFACSFSTMISIHFIIYFYSMRFLSKKFPLIWKTMISVKNMRTHDHVHCQRPKTIKLLLVKVLYKEYKLNNKKKYFVHTVYVRNCRKIKNDFLEKLTSCLCILSRKIKEILFLYFSKLNFIIPKRNFCSYFQF